MGQIQSSDRLHPLPLPLTTHASGAGEIQDGVSAAEERDTLMAAREEAAPPIRGSSPGSQGTGLQDHEGRQVLGLAP